VDGLETGWTERRLKDPADQDGRKPPPCQGEGCGVRIASSALNFEVEGTCPNFVRVDGKPLPLRVDGERSNARRSGGSPIMARAAFTP
jgi:hypothetical protein